ncbi:Protein LTV1 [Leucoagaricus sp. SymC.cos]|nr:Protein LTV1 [Leucoagaricus sp. SymC.cos]
MPLKKSIFRQPGAKHFQLVHRSQRDPLIHDPDASKHVLKPFERENTKKGKSRADLESLLPPSVVESDKNRNVGEAALYGIYYDDTEYDYMQHLRTVGVQEDGVDSILVEAPMSKKNKGKGKIDDSLIPQEALPSASELPRNYESQQAVPESIAGFQPDMDPHLRQALEALEDDAFVDDDLTDDFFGDLMDGGERGTEDVRFEFDEDSIDDVADAHIDEDESDAGDLGWEERFARFKRSQARADKNSTSDNEFASEAGDTIGGLPEITVIGGKGKRRRKGSSDASGYSMSSSSMHRNEALQILDERFDQIFGKQYQDEDDEEEPPASDEDTDEAPELITSREDFDAMINEFLHDYEILGRKMKPKLEGDTPTDKLDTIRRALGQDDRVRVNDDDYDEAQDVLALKDTPKEDRWDCETILTTYSNLENHPRIIRVNIPKSVPKISLDPKTGFPLVNDLPSSNSRRGSSAEDDSNDTEAESTAVKRTTISRPRKESKEEKKARKSVAKTDKQDRRAEKRATKEQFEAELKAQKRVLSNKPQRVKKL